MSDAFDMNRGEVVLEVRNLHLSFDNGGAARKQVLQNLSLGLRRGEVLALVGESGCGKSTLGKVLTGLLLPESGEVVLHGAVSNPRDKVALRERRRKLQMVFQDPYSSIDPRMTMRRVLEEPMKSLCPDWDAARRRARAAELMDGIRLDRSYLDKHAHEMSGGQRQRIGLARALACSPEILVCDEPVSALDVSVQAQILQLLGSCREEYELSVLFISHDMGVVRTLADRVAVMNEGKIVELGETEAVFRNPQSDYTKYLLDAVPRLRTE